MSRETIGVYTAVYGGSDAVTPPVHQNGDVEFLCFTDSEDLVAPGWEIVFDPPRFEQPRLSAKVHKMLPHEVMPDHRWTVWVDGNVVIDNPDFAAEALSYVGESGIATFAHPNRRSIYEEAEACMALPKCAGQPIREQVASYRASGLSDGTRLFGLRCIARDSESAKVRELGERWLAECTRWSLRDQLSFPVVARSLGIEPAVFPHHIHRHTPAEALSCWVSRQRGVAPMMRRLSRFKEAAGGRNTPRAPVPRRWWAIGNPWFDVTAHLDPVK